MRAGLGALCVLALALGCQSSEKRSRATRVSAQDQLIGGPKAIGEIGDYLIENDQIRVIIHGPGINRGSTLFPGAILDVDLQRPQGSNGRGNDQVGEISPAFLFEAFNPTSFEVTSDGASGGDAVITVEGTGGDLLEAMALLNTGILFPPPLRFRIEYRLAPGARHLEIVTTVKNEGDSIHPLPFLDPPDLRDLGLDIPGLDQLTLSVPMGHFALFGGETRAFAAGPTGFNLRFSVEDSYRSAGGLPAFPGVVSEYIAMAGEGVSYALAVPSSPSNYPSAFSDLYPGQTVTDHSMLVPFLFSAVVATYSANPPPELIPGGEFSYTTFLAVGRGDVASVTDVIFEDIQGVETGTFAGRVYDKLSTAPVAHASIMVSDGDSYVTQIETDSDGAFRALLRPGDYQYRVVAKGRYPSEPVAFSVSANRITSVLPIMPPPATILVQVRDEDGRALPCKLTMVGRFADVNLGRDPRDFLYDLALGESIRPTSFEDGRTEFIEKVWYSADGRFRHPIRPGAYDLVVSRGTEYDAVTESVTLVAGTHVEREVTLVRSVDTRGYVAADLHLHSANSVDSGLSIPDRIISIVGEGVEYAAATDHNFVTDYNPEIARQGLTDWLESSIGLEITTFEMGHFNAFPINHDSSTTRGGKFEWVGIEPQAIFDQLRGLGNGDTIVQVNHPRWDFLGYFNVFNLDQDLGQPQVRQGLRSVFAPNGPEFALENFSLDFDTVEIINGKRYDLLHTYRSPAVAPPPPVPDPLPPPGEVVRDSAGQVAFPGAMEDWFVLLNRGERFTGVGASDSHKTVGHEPGFPRTYVFVGDGNDGFGAFTEADVIAGLRSHRAVISMGPFVELTANGAPIGSDVSASGGQVALEIRVSAPNWAPADQVVVWSNGDKLLELDIPAGQRQAFTHSETVTLAADAWILVEVIGSTNTFPVIPPKEYASLSPSAIVGALASGFDLSGLDPFGNLSPAETFAATPLAMTNPIWVDVDGDGQFTAPNTSGLGSTTTRAPPLAPGTDPDRSRSDDIRAAFESFEEVGP